MRMTCDFLRFLFSRRSGFTLFLSWYVIGSFRFPPFLLSSLWQIGKVRYMDGEIGRLAGQGGVWGRWFLMMMIIITVFASCY